MIWQPLVRIETVAKEIVNRTLNEWLLLAERAE
jgi:hypothetical protein